MTPCRRAGRVSNIQDCQSDSQFSTIKLFVCLILGKLHDHSYNNPKLAFRQMTASSKNFFFSKKKMQLQLSTFGKGQNNYICSQVYGILYMLYMLEFGKCFASVFSKCP